MRTREDFEKEVSNRSSIIEYSEEIVIELLLDIRDLLIPDKVGHEEETKQ